MTPAPPACGTSSPACAANGNEPEMGSLPICQQKGSDLSALQILKSDTFGTICRDGVRVIRDTRPARPWARWLARYLMRRERRALAHLASVGIPGIPRVLATDRDTLTRSWI